MDHHPRVRGENKKIFETRYKVGPPDPDITWVITPTTRVI